MSKLNREQIALAMFTAMLPRVIDKQNKMATDRGGVKVVEGEMSAAWKFADLWISQRPKEENDEYCPLSDPNHPHGIQFRNDSPPIKL